MNCGLGKLKKVVISGKIFCLIPQKGEKTMTDEQKELFSRYTDAVREYQTMAECLLFQNSFKLGARMMLEVMEE